MCAAWVLALGLKGGSITRVDQTNIIDTGMTTVTLRFSGSDIGQHNDNGPWLVHDLIITAPNGTIVLDKQAVHKTNFYYANQFGPIIIQMATFTPTPTPTPTFTPTPTP